MKVASSLSESLLLAGGILSFLFFSCATVTFAQPPLPQDPTKGARLFVNKGCVKCHALKGEGGNVGPDLGGSIWEILNWILPENSGTIFLP